MRAAKRAEHQTARVAIGVLILWGLLFRGTPQIVRTPVASDDAAAIRLAAGAARVPATQPAGTLSLALP